MPFCPTCRYEYREGVTHCPDCHDALIAELSDEGVSAQASPEAPLADPQAVALDPYPFGSKDPTTSIPIVVPTAEDANHAVAKLQEAGIRAGARPEHHPVTGAVTGYSLIVAPNDLARAEETLGMTYELPDDFDVDDFPEDLRDQV